MNRKQKMQMTAVCLMLAYAYALNDETNASLVFAGLVIVLSLTRARYVRLRELLLPVSGAMILETILLFLSSLLTLMPELLVLTFANTLFCAFFGNLPLKTLRPMLKYSFLLMTGFTVILFLFSRTFLPVFTEYAGRSLLGDFSLIILMFAPFQLRIASRLSNVTKKSVRKEARLSLDVTEVRFSDSEPSAALTLVHAD